MGRYLKRLLLRFMHMAVAPYQWARKQRLLRDHPVVGGVHAVPLTSAGKIVMVQLNYAKGWRFPGGGRVKREDPEDAILRELREEIGLISHGAVQTVDGTDGSFLFLVRDVSYRAPAWSLEVRQVRAFSPCDVPSEMAEVARQQLERVGTLL